VGRITGGQVINSGSVFNEERRIQIIGTDKIKAVTYKMI
jgi:hypothetical protein